MQGESDIIFQSILIATLVILVFVVFIILFVIVYQQRLSRQKQSMLEREAEYQKELLQASIESQEKERERIARDLHDEIGAMLSTINLGAIRFQRKAEPGSAGEQFSLQTKELVDATADQMRRISRDLMPSTLGRFGWLASVKELFEVIEKQGGIKTKIMEGEGLPQLRPEEALGLYRIIQEATNNTLKHAEATLIQLEVKKGTAGLELKYSDNGKGFSLPEAKDRKSLGLKNIESRAQILGAKLEILSAEREGVKISINLPVV